MFERRTLCDLEWAKVHLVLFGQLSHQGARNTGIPNVKAAARRTCSIHNQTIFALFHSGTLTGTTAKPVSHSVMMFLHIIMAWQNITPERNHSDQMRTGLIAEDRFLLHFTMERRWQNCSKARVTELRHPRHSNRTARHGSHCIMMFPSYQHPISFVNFIRECCATATLFFFSDSSSR